MSNLKRAKPRVMDEYVIKLVELDRQQPRLEQKSIRREYQNYMKKHGRKYATELIHIKYKDYIDEIKAYEENELRNINE